MSNQSLVRLLPLLLVLLVAVCPLARALDVGANPPAYLNEKFRADWRQKPLAQVLDELSAWIERPVTRSVAVVSLETRTVTLVDEHKIPLRETLELFERTQQLHLTAEPLRLRVETAEDYRNRRRRLVDLNLRDYGTFFIAKDSPAPGLGWLADYTGGGLALFSEPANAAKSPEAEDIIDRLRVKEHHGGMELRGNGNIYISVTPEEEAETRTTLLEMYRTMVRRTDWRITFGTLPVAEAPAGGLMARPAAVAIVARLSASHSLTLSSMNGNIVNAATRLDRAQVSDASVVANHLDPNVEVLAMGKGASLRALSGFRCTWIGFTLSWADPLPDGPVATLRSSAKHSSPPEDATVTLKKDEAGPVTATVSAAPVPQGQPGESLSLTQPALWLWQPRGECYLPTGSAMVFVADHPAGRAIIVLEETTP